MLIYYFCFFTFVSTQISVQGYTKCLMVFLISLLIYGSTQKSEPSRGLEIKSSTQKHSTTWVKTYFWPRYATLGAQFDLMKVSAFWGQVCSLSSTLSSICPWILDQMGAGQVADGSYASRECICAVYLTAVPSWLAHGTKRRLQPTRSPVPMCSFVHGPNFSAYVWNWVWCLGPKLHVKVAEDCKLTEGSKNIQLCE